MKKQLCLAKRYPQCLQSFALLGVTPLWFQLSSEGNFLRSDPATRWLVRLPSRRSFDERLARR